MQVTVCRRSDAPVASAGDVQAHALADVCHSSCRYWVAANAGSLIMCEQLMLAGWLFDNGSDVDHVGLDPLE